MKKTGSSRQSPVVIGAVCRGHCNMSATDFPETGIAQPTPAASRTTVHAASFSTNDNEACAGLVDGSALTGIFAASEFSVGSTIRRYISAAFLPLKKTCSIVGQSANSRAKLLTVTESVSIDASRLPGRIQLLSTSHSATRPDLRTSIRCR